MSRCWSVTLGGLCGLCGLLLWCGRPDRLLAQEQGRTPAAPLRAAQEQAGTPATPQASSQPWCHKVVHTPEQPKSGQPVTVMAMVSPRMSQVTLRYQLVEPGAYVELADPEYARNWTAVEMKRGAIDKGYVAYTADLPGDLQKHRRLVRYRITAVDEAGKSQISPMIPATPATAASPAKAGWASNYGYFVYDGLPAWRGAINPRSRNTRLSEAMTFSPEILGRVQVYHLLGKKRSIENATWNEQTPGNEYKYTGTLVANGRVYDHVRYRARGGIWRYALGKNMWKIDLPPGEHMRLTDDLGRPYPVGWNKLNLRSCFQLGYYGHRGEQGMYEAVNFRLWNMVGVPAPYLHWVHFRIIDEADESPADQYHGDFWGLYQAIENEDGRFLKTHDLPDGNLYKMVRGFTGELNHHGAGQPEDRSDLDAFLEAYTSGRPGEQWWRQNLNLESYYSYRSIIECVHHYDIYEGKNYSYYRNPKTGLWQVLPWDADLTWADTMHGDGEEPFNSRLLNRRPFLVEYQNRLREVRDLLFNPDQIDPLVDEVAALVWDPAHANSGILEADRRKWDYHPRVTDHRHAGQGKFYQATPTRDFAGMLQLMKQYVIERSQWIDTYLTNDPRIPETPTASYGGETGYPANGLRFSTESYRGRAECAAVAWRLAEVIPADKVKRDPRTPHAYEINALWQSEAKRPGEVSVPASAVKPGHTYRVRVRMRDTTGRWSHWSAPVEFTVGGK
ncbi:MAG TPA: CotH kinase family protein [Tepidisphaeraceae bacterium]